MALFESEHIITLFKFFCLHIRTALLIAANSAEHIDIQSGNREEKFKSSFGM